MLVTCQAGMLLARWQHECVHSQRDAHAQLLPAGGVAEPTAGGSAGADPTGIQTCRQLTPGHRPSTTAPPSVQVISHLQRRCGTTPGVPRQLSLHSSSVFLLTSRPTHLDCQMDVMQPVDCLYAQDGWQDAAEPLRKKQKTDLLSRGGSPPPLLNGTFCM